MPAPYKIVISQIAYLDEKTFDEGKFKFKDARIMDRFSKLAITTAHILYKGVIGEEIESHKMAIVIATKTGPRQSVREMSELLSKRGVVGINPSKFPNIMMSTIVSRVSIELGITGPSVPIYLSNDKMYTAIQYGIIQINNNRCDGVIVVFVNENKGCFGLFIENEEQAKNRGIKPRFFIKERN